MCVIFTETITVGISRLQSGSHTMSYYMADLLESKLQQRVNSNSQGQTWQKNQLKFKELGSFSNLRDGNVYYMILLSSPATSILLI
jgi:hypothetical protein